MKLITLNTWGARVKEPFREFIRTNKDTDIFCFQEIYDRAEEVMKDYYPEANHNLNMELQELLPQHNSFFRPALKGVYGVGIYIKKEVNVLEEGEIIIHKNIGEPLMSGHHDRNMQWIKCEMKGVNFIILNIHGLWNGHGKSDTPARIAQSQRIREFMDSLNEPKILCGDFNLLPDTRSIEIIESAGMRNLIKEYNITSTRTELYTKEPKYADYVFVSPEIKIEDFRVLPDVVSDHAPLTLSFDLQ